MSQSELPLLATMNPITANAFSRLIKALGTDKALRIGGEALRSLGLRELRDQNEVLAFAKYLIALSGVAEAVGRGLKVSALLRGAVDKVA